MSADHTSNGIGTVADGTPALRWQLIFATYSQLRFHKASGKLSSAYLGAVFSLLHLKTSINPCSNPGDIFISFGKSESNPHSMSMRAMA